jgi:hypothetical protein
MYIRTSMTSTFCSDEAESAFRTDAVPMAEPAPALRLPLTTPLLGVLVGGFAVAAVAAGISRAERDLEDTPAEAVGAAGGGVVVLVAAAVPAEEAGTVEASEVAGIPALALALVLPLVLVLVVAVAP